MDKLHFDLIARGWAKFGDDTGDMTWKLVEINLTKYAEFRDEGIHIDDWYDVLSTVLEKGGIHTLWTKDEDRDQFIFESHSI